MPPGVPGVWMFDVNQDRWCVREIDPSVGEKFTIGAADGGLVCFVYITAEDILTIVVMNPLTGKKVELPRLLRIHDELPTIHTSMLHLKVNRKNNHYLVYFVGCIDSVNEGLLAQVYDPQTKEWSIVGSREKSWGCISGHLYDWGNFFDSNGEPDYPADGIYGGERRGPGLYDFAQEELPTAAIYDIALADANANAIASEHARFTVKYTMFRDWLFILHPGKREDPSSLNQEDPAFKLIISEYHLRRNAAAWVKGGTHGCEPLDGYPDNDHYFFVEACNGYLMVMAHEIPSDQYLHVWLYNLSTYSWHFLPDIPGYDYFNDPEHVLMCELRWSATP